jgi:hypothetical protein
MVTLRSGHTSGAHPIGLTCAVHMFETQPVEMTLIGHWWNGQRGPFARGELFLRRHPNGSYEVQIRVAGKDRLIEGLTRDRAAALASKVTSRQGWVQVQESARA